MFKKANYIKTDFKLYLFKYRNALIAELSYLPLQMLQSREPN